MYIQNTGLSDAYVRTRIVIPQSLTASIEEGSPPVTVNMTDSDEYLITSNIGIECGGELCDEYIFTRAEVLQAGQMTTNPTLHSIVYNEVASAGTELENTEVESPTFDMATSGIKVYTEAIQAQGFASYEDAFANFN